MNKIGHCHRTIKQLCYAYTPQVNSLFSRNFNGEENTRNKRSYSSDEKLEPGNSEKTLKLYKVLNEKGEGILPKSTSFTKLLRHSKFIDLGDPDDSIVQGEIFHTVDDDLYIDFGWKFHCVCLRPRKDANKYVRGSKVKLMIKDLELSSRFLGASSDLTLLEADCILVGLIESPVKPK